MGGDEYAAAGGSLKLKGVKDSKVDKKRKKKKAKAQPENETIDQTTTAEAGEEHPVRSREGSLGIRASGEVSTALIVGKTEAERRHEEMRRKRVCKDYAHAPVSTDGPGIANGWLLVQLDERLKREGIKTHKERVEELNKYLSNLSEHHDM